MFEMEGGNFVRTGVSQVFSASYGYCHFRGRERRVVTVKRVVNFNIAKRSPRFFGGFERFCICVLAEKVFRDLLRLSNYIIPKRNRLIWRGLT